MSPDRRKLRQKAHYVREAVAALERIRSAGREAFLANPLAEPAATRWLQVAIEAVLDATHHVIAREGWGLPKSYREAIDLLVAHQVLPVAARSRFHAMVAFRNRAVHLYDEIEAEQVFSMLEKDLGDFELFLAAITERYIAVED
jgi:uncharacterized protein YutE (UPF0331/DUF86 family)